jgi:nicotinamide-nucleotide amidase
MLEETILPWLRTHRPLPPIVSRTVNTLGIGESDLVTRFGALLRSLVEVEVAFYPRQPGVQIKLTGRGSEGPARVDRAVAAVRKGMGSLVFGTDDETLAGVVGELLVARGWRLATAESCTGGAIAAHLTAVSGASRYLDRGVVAYADAAKIDLLGVPADLIREHGAVSEPVARAMAEGLRMASGADVVLSTTGIAGPTGGSPEKPVGLVHTALASPRGTEAWRDTHPGTRRFVIQRTVVTAVNRLRLLLKAEG